MKKKIHVVILYHNHQPLYKDSLENFYYLPWVKLHATKDYYDMVVWVEKYNTLKLNFNFVPSLLLQLEDYSKGIKDKYSELTLKPSSQLTFEEKLFILKNFFNCNWDTMIKPFKRYRELLELRGESYQESDLQRKVNYFNNKDWTDLQVWYNLVWFDPYWRKTDKEIKRLFEKGENFTQEDKEIIIRKQTFICGEIIKKYKQLQEESKIEISFSAFYHPILPILLNPQNAKISSPYISLPKNIIPLKEDAEKQIEIAKEYYKEKFGKEPCGFWPSEGAVSDDLVGLLKNFGIKWFATDEDILKKSIVQPLRDIPLQITYTHYKFEVEPPIYVVFRDKRLSDNIGFVYYKWKKEDAIRDIESYLMNIYNFYKDKNFPILVPIILDGENCWEFYPNDGEDFLDEFYNMLTSNEIFETVLLSEYISKYPEAPILKSIWPGSWINANYDIWIGHPEDNKAWEFLYKTRNFLCEFLSNNNVSEYEKNLCWHEIYAAEGSDWFWWFGDEHYTSQSDLFDFLFRQHLKNVYKVLKQNPPSYLDIPIKMSMIKNNIILPSCFIFPTIDGKISSYFEWLNSGRYSQMSSSQHRTAYIADNIFYGFDLENIYIRIDYNEKIVYSMNEEVMVDICFVCDLENNNKIYHVKMPLKKYNNSYILIFPNDVVSEFIGSSMIEKIIEIKIPFNLLDVKPKQKLGFFVIFEKKFNHTTVEIQRLPENGFIELMCPDEDFFKMFWVV